MKRILIACALVLGGINMPFVSAQDCCPLQYDPCCYGQSFDGFYVGGNVGVITHTAHRNDLDGFLSDNSGWTVNNTSVTAGIQLGYDWQTCSRVFGLVWDWDWANPHGRLLNDAGTNADRFIRNRFNWFTTIRARAGLTVSDVLVYVTLGAAATKLHTRWHDGADDFRSRHTRWGWVGGAGAEFMLWCNWSLGLEVLFLHFNEHRRAFTTGGTEPSEVHFGHSDSAWIGRVLLNYRFGNLFCCN